MPGGTTAFAHEPPRVVPRNQPFAIGLFVPLFGLRCYLAVHDIQPFVVLAHPQNYLRASGKALPRLDLVLTDKVARVIDCEPDAHGRCLALDDDLGIDNLASFNLARVERILLACVVAANRRVRPRLDLFVCVVNYA